MGTKKAKSPTVNIESDYLVNAISDVNSAIENLKKQYETKAENPISSVLISLELVQMNLIKIAKE